MSENTVQITVDGKQIEAKPGSMLIEATDAAGIYVPRFCYHGKLSVSANCRMCLVDVEKAPKPMPACATPVNEGMVVHTRSDRATEAQKATMEFLLINHPLDCPVCDQGGECELQDLSVGFGNDASHFMEEKRVMPELELGSLISTEMTRCIHCTRCVRFGEEIAGIREMGATGRGENTTIGTYIKKALNSEISANIIDICPVGALTAKPGRYTARPWELRSSPSISVHDCLGSNTNVLTKNGKIVRLAPRTNEEINEVWLADRDRFAFQGNSAEDRLQEPMVKLNGEWKSVDWEEALDHTATQLKQILASKGPESIGGLASPGASNENLYAFQKFVRACGSGNIDSRLMQQDFSDDGQDKSSPVINGSIADLENINAALLVGANIHQDQPLLGVRIRKAALKGANIHLVNNRAVETNFVAASNVSAGPQQTIELLAAIAKEVAASKSVSLDKNIVDLAAQCSTSDNIAQIAKDLDTAEKARILIGVQAQLGEAYVTIKQLSILIADMVNADFGVLTPGGNSTGAWFAGCLPDGVAPGTEGSGLNSRQMFDQQLSAYVLLGIEANKDIQNPQQVNKALNDAKCVVSLSAYADEFSMTHADVLLPISSYLEESGSYTNMVGDTQLVEPVTSTVGESRPAWKIIKALAETAGFEGFDFINFAELSKEARKTAKSIAIEKAKVNTALIKSSKQPAALYRITEVGVYQSDAMVRRASCLQETGAGNKDYVVVNTNTASTAGIADGDRVNIKQDGGAAVMNVQVDENVPYSAVIVFAGTDEAIKLGANSGEVTLEKV